MKVRYRPTALAQIDAIFSYIEERNPAAASKVTQQLKRSIDLLSEFPYSG